MRTRVNVIAVSLFCSIVLVISFHYYGRLRMMRPAVLVPARALEEGLVGRGLAHEAFLSPVGEDPFSFNSDQQHSEQHSLSISASAEYYKTTDYSTVTTSSITAEEVDTVNNPEKEITEETISRNDGKLILRLTHSSSQSFSSSLHQKEPPTANMVAVHLSPRNSGIVVRKRTETRTLHQKEHSTVTNRATVVRKETRLGTGTAALPTNKNPEVLSNAPTDRFLIRPGFHFPQPRAVKPLQELLQSDWLKDLRATLHTITSKQLTMVTSNLQYRDVLLNWLTSAVFRGKITLENILVISMDEYVHKVLKPKGVKSVLVTPHSFLTEAVRGMGTFPQVMMTRLGIIRLLNHWGFDVINYDTDAILLRDPQPILDRLSNSGIIGTFGKFPQNLNHEWGITLCTAVLAVRSSQQTEDYWEATSKEHLTSFSDQERMNYGLKALGIRWALDRTTALTNLDREVTGVCSNSMAVTLLPYTVACRASNCKKNNNYYVWHKGGHRDGESKMRNAEVGDTWFLRGDWQTACTGVDGYQWFRCISNNIMVT